MTTVPVDGTSVVCAQALPTLPPFEVIYDEHFDLVFRNIRRLGVPEALVDDAVQEVFLVVYRRMGQFEGRSSLKTWIFSIVTRVASDHRRTLRRKSPHARNPEMAIEADEVADERVEGPHERLERMEGVQLLHRLLDQIEDEKRIVLVFAELEGMTVPEIADTLGENVNTVYARLRAARREFEQAVARERARDTWRLR
ncbi:MAG TPA: sigma-70 family RNA polymerase sigma factor [Polyangium sp.]|nr:sigma-70 family RNA polymerase sigma factor [Polyangium sp.]